MLIPLFSTWHKKSPTQTYNLGERYIYSKSDRNHRTTPLKRRTTPMRKGRHCLHTKIRAASTKLDTGQPRKINKLRAILQHGGTQHHFLNVTHWRHNRRSSDDVAVITTTVTNAEAFISSMSTFQRLKHVPFSQIDIRHLKLITGNNTTQLDEAIRHF